jgi:hypothetical protein
VFLPDIGENEMELSQQNQEGFPEWTATSEITFWQPDELFIEWMTFLYGIWETVEYL